MGRTLLLVLAASGVAALNNGLGRTPEMGANTWYMLHSHLLYPSYEWEPGYVMSEDVIAIAAWMKQHGLLDIGYNYMNLDDCIVWNRTESGQLVPDPQAFPNGFRPYTSQLSAMGFSPGTYSDRGNYTCSCYAGGHKRPGSYGHEQQDAEFWVEQGFVYVKDDSCFAPNGVSPLAEYGAQRDALNATGTPVYFNLCWGAGLQVASVGRAYGNAWRIDEDDGGGWGPILQNVNTDAALFNYSGCDSLHNDGLGCGWNDPGLLLVGNGGLSDDQSRSHFGLWAMLAAKLLISVDPRTMTPASIATLTSREVIAIDQDSLGIQARRILPPLNMTRWMEDQARMREGSAARKVLEKAFFEDKEVKLARRWQHKYGVVNPEFSSVYSDLLALVEGTEVHEVLAAGGRTEVWARPLAGGDVAVLLFNNGVAGTQTISCNVTSGCWGALGFSPSTTVSVRDVWTHTDNGTVTGGFSAQAATNASVLVRLTPSTLLA